MGKDTAIEWCHHTFNPWWGCTRVSPGCEKCYAEAFSKRVGLKVWGVQNDRRFFGDKHWAEPEKWNRDAERANVRRRVFCASMADVFEDRRDLDEHRARLWELIWATPWLDWLLLTKRPENHEMVPLSWQTGTRRPLNVWLGTTTENQEYADRRIPLLLEARWPAVRFVSYEPALGPVDFGRYMATPIHVSSVAAKDREAFAEAVAAMNRDGHQPLLNLGPGEELQIVPGRRLDWVIVGGESGPGARPFNIRWARSVIDQCSGAGVACLVKQLGARPFKGPRNDASTGYDIKLADRKGGDMDEWPDDLRIRQYPQPRPTP